MNRRDMAKQHLSHPPLLLPPLCIAHLEIENRPVPVSTDSLLLVQPPPSDSVVITQKRQEQ